MSNQTLFQDNKLKEFPANRRSMSGVLLVSGLILNSWGKTDGPDWTYWLGQCCLGTLFLVPATICILNPQLALAWFRAFKSRRHSRYVTDPMVWQQLHTGDKILVIIGMLIITAITLTILSTAIPNLLETWKSG
jgi:hypothetical protein